MEVYKSEKIGNFFKSIKFGNTEIATGDREMLKKMGIDLSITGKKAEIHQKVLLLVEFYQEFDRVPKSWEVYKDEKLGIFFRSIKSGATQIWPEDRKMLENLGII